MAKQKDNSGDYYDTYQAGRTKTHDFNTANLIDENGEFLGMHVSSESAKSLNVLFSTFTTNLRRIVQDHGARIARQVGSEQLGMNAHEALRFSNKTASVLGYGTIFAKQIAEIGSNVYDTVRATNNLRSAVGPVMALNGHTLPGQAIFTSAGNEVIGNAREKINLMFAERLKSTVVGAVQAAPHLWIMHNEEKLKVAERAKNERFLKAKEEGPEAMGQFWREELALDKEMGGFTGGREGLKELLKGEREAYEKEFEAFAKEREGEVKSALKKELRNSTDSEIRKKYGTSISGSGSGWDSFGSSSGKNSAAKREREKLKEITQNILKKEYVLENGLMDESWRKYANMYEEKDVIASRGEMKTRQQVITDQFNEIQKVMNGSLADTAKLTKGKTDKETSQMTEMFAGAAGALIGDAATSLFGGSKRMEKFKHPMALDRILHLRIVMEKAPGNEPPDMVPGIKDNKSNESDASYAKFIHRIFQQHQKDIDQAEINDRFLTHLQEVNWSDDKVLELHDDELNPYEYAIKHITQNIRSGRMDPIALINLVGDKNNKIVNSSGKNFGPVNATSDEERKKLIGDFIEHNSAELRLNAEMQEGDVNQAMAGFLFSKEEIQHAFGPEGLQGEERAFFFAVLDSRIPNVKELEKLTGLKHEEIDALRTDMKDRYSDLMDAGVLELDDMMHEAPQQIEALHLTAAEKTLISDMARRIERDGVDVINVAERKELANLETVVANATMSIDHDGQGQEDGKENFWQRLVGRNKEQKQAEAEDKAERDEQKEAEKQAEIDAHAREKEERSFAERMEKEDGRDQDSGFAERFGGDGDEMMPSLASRERRKQTERSTQGGYHTSV